MVAGPSPVSSTYAESARKRSPASGKNDGGNGEEDMAADGRGVVSLTDPRVMPVRVPAQGLRQSGVPRRWQRSGLPGLLAIVKALESNATYWDWVGAQRPAVDALYAALFLIGYYVIFVHRTPDASLFSCSPLAGGGGLHWGFPGGAWALCAIRRTLVCLHAVPLATYLYKGGQDRDSSGFKFYIRNVREAAFVSIRLLAAATALLGGGVGSCAGLEAGECPAFARPPHVSWLFTFLLYTGSYQVSRQWQFGLQLFSTACLWLIPIYDWSWGDRVLVVFCALLAPCLCAVGLEAWVVMEHSDRVGPVKSPPLSVDPQGEGTSSDTTPVAPVPSGVDEDGGRMWEEKQAREKQGQAIVRKRQVVAQEKKAAVRDKITFNVQPLLAERQQSSPGEPSDFIHYRPLVHSQTKVIKLKNEGDVSDEKLQELARKFSERLAATYRSGRCVAAKAVVARGCLLFIAEVMEPQEGCSDGKADSNDSKRLLECLPEELQKNPMEVIMGDFKATYENAALKNFDYHNRSGVTLEVPEVMLLRPACMWEAEGSVGELTVFLSEAKGVWESLKLVMVYNNCIREELDCRVGSIQDNLRLRFTKEEGADVGYLHTIGVEPKHGTFVGGLAPFLSLPDPAATELNEAFQRTIQALWCSHNSKSMGSKSMGSSDGLPQDPSALSVESEAWANHFKPFALDMHFLLEPDADELWELMQYEGPQRTDYMRVFLHVAHFLEQCNARETEEYLLAKFEQANIVLTNQHTEVSPGSLFPDKPHYPLQPGLWFTDPNIESQYRYHFSQRAVLMDLAGMVMGLCLLPMVSLLGETGRCLYMCPLVMHLRLSLVCWVASQSTYISNREPIIIMSWAVRTVAWLGWATRRKEMAEAAMHPWTTLFFLLWTVLVKTIVLKVGVIYPVL
ncbi:unnamed protein product [Ostreobium quekettii]|uniref:Uncharacterized protein n=1 Tax=Ostreobium quekettii TaxID=121088 RepID=A0A8S1J8X9_9CHLO|nr:unnamed protein product [Ostreobium quekettii]